MNESQTPQKNRRLSKRKPPRGRVRVACYRGPWEMGKNLGVSLLDLSETGIRLVVAEDLPIGQEVTLNLESTSNARPVKRTGRVVWSLPTAGRHCVGIHFGKRIDYADFIILT